MLLGKPGIGQNYVHFFKKILTGICMNNMT